MKRAEFRSRALHTLVLAVGCAASGAVFAAPFCKLGPPRLVKAGEASIEVQLTCAEMDGDGRIPYSSGPLHAGMTLYKLRKDAAGTVRITDDGEGTDLESIEIASPKNGLILRFHVAGIGEHSHAVVAVWDSKDPCEGGARCDTMKYTLGRTDAFNMPAPIDAFPRPVCNVQRLTEKGYFQWIEENADALWEQGPALEIPDEIAFMMNGSDCWSKTDGPGLGYSVYRWRAQRIE